MCYTVALILLCLVSYLCQFASSELILFTKNINSHIYSVKCVTTGSDINSTLSWNNLTTNFMTSTEEKYIPFNKNVKNWLLLNSSDFMELPPVLDERWEDFKIIKTDSSYHHKIDISSKKYIKLSIYTNADVKLFFKSQMICLSNLPLPAVTFIIIEFNTWIHIDIIMNDNKIKIKYNTQIIEINKVNEVFLHSTQTTFWKIHDYSYLLSQTSQSSEPIALISHSGGPLCLKTFVTMCPQCSLTLTSSFAQQFDLTLNPGKGWKEVTLYSDNPKNDQGMVTIWSNTSSTSTENNFWIINQFKRCTKDLRVSTIFVTNPNQLSCSTLGNTKSVNNSQQMVIQNFNCPINKFGKFCNISCSDVYNKSSECYGNRICNHDNGCFCSWGFYKSDCKTGCPKNFWGINCKRSCGHCYKNISCDSRFGLCDHCKTGYYPPYCSQKIPILEKNSDDSLLIKFEPEYDVDELPFFIECQYRIKGTVEWQTNSVVVLQKNILFYCDIRNLESKTWYEVRALLNPSRTYFLEDEAPVGTFRTKCKENLVRENIIVEKKLIKLNNMDRCFNNTSPNVFYIFEFTCIDSQCSSESKKEVDSGTILQTDNPIIEIKMINLIHFYSKYSLDIRLSSENNDVTEIKGIEFMSESKRLGKVSNFQVYSRNNNKLKLRWKQPNPVTAKILGYAIQIANQSQNYTYVILSNQTILEDDKNFKIVPCFWEDYRCIEVRNLEQNIKYNAFISAIGEELGEFESISDITTMEKPPSAPQNISGNIRGDKLILQWNHPFIPNGQIKSFDITIEVLEDNLKSRTMEPLHKKIDVESKMYNDSIPWNFSTTYKISVVANNQYKGESSTIGISTPPPQPKMSSEPFVKDCSASDCILTIPPLLTVTKNSKLYVVAANLSRGLNPQLTNLTRIFGKIEFDQDIVQSDYWIAANQTVIEEREFDIVIKGDLNHTINRTILESINFTLCIILVNSYKNELNYKLYYIKNDTHTPSLDVKWILIISFIFIILLLIGVAVSLFLRKKYYNDNIYDYSPNYNYVTGDRYSKTYYEKCPKKSEMIYENAEEVAEKDKQEPIYEVACENSS